MDTRVQIVAILATALLLVSLLELVRRRRMLERYAIVWLGSVLALLALAAWSGLLTTVSNAIGIAYPPSTLFVIAFGFVLVLLLHFSIAVSKLADQSKVLAQRVALLEERNGRLEAQLASRRSSSDEEVEAPARTFARPMSGVGER
jgi:hypothetical protein